MQRAVGKPSSLPLAIRHFDTFQDRLFEAFSLWNAQSRALASIIIWKLWTHINGLVWRNKESLPHIQINGAKDFLTQYREAQSVIQIPTPTGIAEPVCNWAKPKEDWLKCNVDAAIFEAEKMIGMGRVIRDHNGVFVATKMLSKEHSSACVRLVEALSLREALSWIKDLKMQKIHVEVDALLIVQARSSPNFDNTVFALTIDDCRLLLNEIVQCKISHIRRSTNQVSHSITRASVVRDQ